MLINKVSQFLFNKSEQILITFTLLIQNMISNHLALFVPGSQPNKQMDVDEKKMVKMFVYQHPQTWIQYVKGVLILEHSQQDNLSQVNLKIRLVNTTNLSEIQAVDFLPFHIQSDHESPFLIIKDAIISTIENQQDEKVLYLKLKIADIVIALSFLNKTYFKSCLEQIFLGLQAHQDHLSWKQKNISLLINQTLDMNFNRLAFTDKSRIKQFCAFVKQAVKSKNISFSGQTLEVSEEVFEQMNPYFNIVKNLTVYFDKDILNEVTSNQQLFQCLLMCYSFNPFGSIHHNYLLAYQKTLKINNHLDIQNKSIIKNYVSSIKIKFLKDVALCTFIQIFTQARISQVINQNYTKILTIIVETDQIFYELIKLSSQNAQHFIYIFIQLWQVFKAVLQDINTKQIKNTFYNKWSQHKLFQTVLTVFNRFAKQKETKISQVNPRIWQKFTESMNVMMSYNWVNAEQKILAHYQNSANSQRDLMASLIPVIKQCDLNTKIIILDFVKAQIQVSQNRKVIKQRHLSYLFGQFVVKSYQHFNSQDCIQKFLEFIIKIYEAEPIRTRQSIIQQNLFQILKKFQENKYVFIMVIKLLKKFVESSQNTDLFIYLSNRNFFASLRQKYAIYQHSKNIINSLFLNLFKSVQNCTSESGRKYIYNIFFPNYAQQVNSEVQKQQKELLNVEQESLKYKRPLSMVNGTQNQLISD